MAEHHEHNHGAYRRTLRAATVGNFAVAGAELFVATKYGESVIWALFIHDFSDALAHALHEYTEHSDSKKTRQFVNKVRKIGAAAVLVSAVGVGVHSAYELATDQAEPSLNVATVAVAGASVGLNTIITRRHRKNPVDAAGYHDSLEHNEKDIKSSGAALAATLVSPVLPFAPNVAGLYISYVSVGIAKHIYTEAVADEKFNDSEAA